MARAVLVMSMDEMDKSSLSAASEGSGVAAATSESEKPANQHHNINSRINPNGTGARTGDTSTNLGPSLSGRVEEELLPAGPPAPRPTHPHFGWGGPSKAPEERMHIHINHLEVSKLTTDQVPTRFFPGLLARLQVLSRLTSVYP